MKTTSLIEYISDADRRKTLAAGLFTSPDYLWQMATGWRGKRPSPRMAMAIERATNGAVPAAQLRPDVFDPITNAVTGYVVPVAQPQSEAA